jgi:hypothetical protein
MADFAPALSHGPIAEVFPDVFQVTGGFRFAPLLSITRNMTIVRQGGALTVLNSVRLSPEGEAGLAKLGKVEHVVRVGAFHGLDDPYYVDRYRATLWGPPGTKHAAGLTARDLAPGASPIEGATVFLFEGAKRGEAVVVLDRDGGAIVTCDSYQNWTSFEGCSALGKLMMKAMGFGPTLIGGPWIKEMGPGVRPDFDRLLELRWKHLVPAHGAVLRDTAKDGLRKAIASRFG